MSWTARQHTLLRALGLQVWSAPADLPASLPAPAAAPAKPALTKATVAVAERPAARAAALPPPAATRPVPGDSVAASKRVVRGDVATLAWQPLRQAVASCTACGLCQSRKQAVFGSGAVQAHWLVVGEAPGEQEDLQGLPFVGPSGALLDHMLQALRLTRAEGAKDTESAEGAKGDEGAEAAEGAAGPPPSRRVFIVNTVKCRPPKNRNPTAEELATCEPFLLRQIELLQPRIILALGAFAIKALLRSDEPIGKLRGRVHRYQGVPVVVSYHPAYLLRQPLEKARAWEDLCLAADTAEAASA